MYLCSKAVDLALHSWIGMRKCNDSRPTNNIAPRCASWQNAMILLTRPWDTSLQCYLSCRYYRMRRNHAFLEEHVSGRGQKGLSKNFILTRRFYCLHSFCYWSKLELICKYWENIYQRNCQRFSIISYLTITPKNLFFLQKVEKI